MSTNDTQDQGATVGGLAGMLHGVNWPGAVALLGLLALFAVGPRFGVDPERAAAGVAAVIAAYTWNHARAANKQTNGSLTDRLDSSVKRGTDELRAELPALIRQALDTTPERSPWLDGGDTPESPPAPSWAPGTYSQGQ